MNRLQKKCIIATAGFHLLLLVILFVGPAFFWEREKQDDTQTLEMIPANLVDAATTGIQGAQPPPPAPVVVTPSQPTPTPPAPVPTPVKPDVTPSIPTLKPEKVEPVKPPKDTIKPDLTPVDRTPADKPSETKPPAPKVNLTLTTRTVPKNTSTTAKPATTPDNSKAVNSALRSLRNNLSTPTTIAPVGNSSVAAANYGQVVRSVYEQAWILPDDMASDQANTKIRVTIASDGTVISARIISQSGDAKLDESVRRTLDRVQFIAPFPPGTIDRERTYIINFNPQVKRMNG